LDLTLFSAVFTLQTPFTEQNMPLSHKTEELARLIRAFEGEASKFHALEFSLHYLTQTDANFNRTFVMPHHAIMLWQYYGKVDGEIGAALLVKSIAESDLQWAIPGAEITCFGLLEGEGCELFIRMAQRAGSLFDEVEANALKVRVLEELLAAEKKRHTSGKPTASSNTNPLAIWLNYLLFHLSLTNPGREKATKIEPDPFALSLLALERLLADRSIGKVDKSSRRLEELSFRVAMSFPGEHRSFVATVVNALRSHLPTDSIFYDHDYQAQLAKPNLDTLLQRIYRDKSELIVIFLCKMYAEKQWCGLEWRAIRDMIKSRQDERIMFVRFDDSAIDGVFSLDGYIDAREHGPQKVAEFILERLSLSN
jgi:TIR domain